MNPQRASASAADGSDLQVPGLGASVRLCAQDGSAAPDVDTRVDDVRDGRIAVHAPPPRPGDLEPPADGTAFELRWTTPRGLVVLPVVLAERVRTPAPLWWLAPAGPAERHQRRDFVRAEAAGPLPVQVEVLWEHPEPGRTTGDLVDLSEGGLRARIRAPRWALGCAEGSAVAVRLTITEVDDDAAGDPLALRVVEHELGGTVLRTADASAEDWDASDSADVVVQLHDDVRQGNALRSLVFSWQRRARRS